MSLPADGTVISDPVVGVGPVGVGAGVESAPGAGRHDHADLENLQPNRPSRSPSRPSATSPTRPNPQRPWLRSSIDMAKLPFKATRLTRNAGHETRRRQAATPTPAQSGFDASRKTTLQRLENIYHEKFTCFYKVPCASFLCSTGADPPSVNRLAWAGGCRLLQAIHAFLLVPIVESSEPATSVPLPAAQTARSSTTLARGV